MMNILPAMIAPYQTICACGRTIPRLWPLSDAEAMCDYCAKIASDPAAQPELELRRAEGRASSGRALDPIGSVGI
jgi:hypothetical protein